jgi:hypothetical protein
MDHQLAEYFFDEASKAFAFLVSDHSFAAPRLQVDDNINFAFVVFMGSNLALECILDEREADIDCKIARVTEGNKTTFYAVDEAGNRMREGLASLLRRRGVRGRLFEQVGELDLRGRIKVTLADFAAMLKNHCEDVMNDSPTALA